MNEFVDHIKQWSLDEFGIIIHQHQSQRVQDNITAYLSKKGLTEAQLFELLQNKENPYFDEIIDVITVQEGYFFRDISLFSFLKYTYLPRIIREKHRQNNKRLAIWSAGSSKGEEIYTIAMLLHELLIDINDWQIDLLATDINQFALNFAKQGHFKAGSLRSINRIYIEKHFKVEDDKFLLNDNIKKMVHFECHNLNALSPPKESYFDLVLCRNALIYLEQKTVKNSLDLFYSSLSNHRALFLGPSDLITYNVHLFESHHEESILYFLKVLPDSKISIPIKKVPLSKPKEQVYVHRVQNRVKSLGEIVKLLAKSSYEIALKKINHLFDENAPSSLLYRYKAQALIGLGDRMTACDCLSKSIHLEPKDAKSFYLKGLCLQEDDLDEAMFYFNQAISLSPIFPEAMYTLSLLLLRVDRIKEGLRMLSLTLKQGNMLDKDEKLLTSNESMSTLCINVEKELHYYKDLFNDQSE